MALSDLQRTDLDRVVRVCTALGSERDPDRLLDLILHEACALVRADRASLFLVDTEHRELVTRIAQGTDEIRLPLGRGIAGTVAVTAKPVMIDDAYADPRFDPEHDRRSGYRTCTMLCMPLIDHEDAVVGVIQVLNRNDGPFTTHDQQLLGALCAQAAVSIVSTRLMRAEVERQRLERDLELARQIQIALLPDTPPAIPGWRLAGYSRSCDKTGGDYYDFLPTADGCDVVIGDVSGHGLGAAMLMSTARAFLRALHEQEPNPGRIITRMNALLERDMADDAFMSFFFARLTQDGGCALVNAGHEPPLIYRTGRGVDEIEIGGLLLGMLPDMAWEPTEVPKLAPGDLIVLFTDGIFEAQAPPRFEQFGIARMKDIIERTASQGALAVREALIAAVEAWLGGHSPHDDMTLVVAQHLSEELP
jgi:sigma-B regulation protein RsbU (phosphoserine phosphatase)